MPTFPLEISRALDAGYDAGFAFYSREPLAKLGEISDERHLLKGDSDVPLEDVSRAYIEGDNLAFDVVIARIPGVKKPTQPMK